MLTRYAAPLAVGAWLAAAGGAHAATVEYKLECTPQGSTGKIFCTAPTFELVGPQAFHAEVAVRYEFACQGHAIGLRLASDSASVPVAFGGSGGAAVRLEGYGPFVLRDFDPEKTRRATLRGECVVKVEMADLSPSQQTLILWKEKAKDLARLIDATLDRAKHAKGTQKVITWDDEQLAATGLRLDEMLALKLPPDLAYEDLVYPVPCDKPGRCGELKDAEDMPEAWTIAVIMEPSLPDIIALKAQIASIQAGRPPVYDPADLDRIKADLASLVAEATAIIRNGETWTAKLDAELRALVERLKTLRDRAQTA